MKKEKNLDLMQRFLAEAQKKYGADACYRVTDHEQTHYGVALPPLALQYLLCGTVLPMERLILLSGPFGSCKSALGYELLRFVTEARGMGTIVETENKSSASLMLSLLGKEHAEMVRFHRAGSMEDGQRRISSELQTYLQLVPKKDVPMMVFLDSLVGVKTEETIEKIDKAGSADRGFSKEALIISNYFASMADKLIGAPVVLVLTNHEKEKLDTGRAGYGPQIRNPGGAAPDFHATYHLRCQKVGTMRDGTGVLIKLQTKKNSLGPDRRSITVDFRWEMQAEGDRLVQTSRFDWDKALAELLAGEDVPRAQLNDLVQVKMVSGMKFNCPTFKLKEAPPAEVGKAIQADAELVKRLRQVLGVFSWREVGGA